LSDGPIGPVFALKISGGAIPDKNNRHIFVKNTRVELSEIKSRAIS